MPVALEQVVPWGRSLDEYRRMFDLGPGGLECSILDCAAGPASFNAEMHSLGHTVISCDPLYRFSASEISGRIGQTYQAVLDATTRNRDNFVWREIQSPEALGEMRMNAMKRFLQDFLLGISQSRYRNAELPKLPFAAAEFDLALCSHFLFTYSVLLGLKFHLDSIRELCRVAKEVRVFPLVEQFGTGRSELVPPVLAGLAAEGYRCEVTRVPYEFQKGGNEMLWVSR